MNSETRVWAVAIATSLALHGALVLFAPQFARAPKEEPVMRVSLAYREAPTPAPPAPAIQQQPKPQQPKTQQPAKPAAKPAEPVKKTTVKKTDKPTTQTKTEISATPAQEPQPQSESSAQTAGATSDAASNVVTSGTPGGTGNSNAVVDIGGLAVTKKITPDYPSFSRKRKEEGTVKIIITIENGGVTGAEIEQSSGYERLDASALRAVKQWRFDHADKVRARVPFTFKLK